MRELLCAGAISGWLSEQPVAPSPDDRNHSFCMWQ